MAPSRASIQRQACQFLLSGKKFASMDWGCIRIHPITDVSNRDNAVPQRDLCFECPPGFSTTYSSICVI
ncbi:hypothetical protein TGAM01_v211145 [Trichoderma gamsii]|uniref:Uncharacterized protein n=1 Tax=Trichoderma gamsii TaxID=398673 RepID=A0A2P4Z6S6_9HYPO|nr:hypothetical protein TGAM01_v211145 [Trichoderma gamsii]PON19985.1 hypothetical protein TGAM01_v211145 [Trichoderma gamsii]